MTTGRISSMPDKNRGLHERFRVERTDGSSEPGGKHDGCEYFVLDLDHDRFAIDALIAYEAACADEYPALARDLRDRVIAKNPEKAEQIVFREYNPFEVKNQSDRYERWKKSLAGSS